MSTIPPYICSWCGRGYSDISVKKGDFFTNTEVCKPCYDRFANDPEQCFGKQFPSGISIATDTNEECNKCLDKAVCSKWPKNPTKYSKLSEIKETEMSAKKTADNTAAVEQTEPETQSAAPAAEPAKPAAPPTPTTPPPASRKKATSAAGNGKGKGKGKGAAAASTKKASDPDSWVEFPKGLKWRKGTSAALAATILLKNKSITLVKAAAELKKSGCKSDNYPARILTLAAVLISKDLLSRKSENGEVTFFKK